MKKKKYRKPDIKSEKIQEKKVLAQPCDKCPSSANRTFSAQCKAGVSKFY